MDEPAIASLVDLLRHCSREAWAEVTEPNGWSYHTNIGKLLHDAADEIERLQAAQSVRVYSEDEVTEVAVGEYKANVRQYDE